MENLKQLIALAPKPSKIHDNFSQDYLVFDLNKLKVISLETARKKLKNYDSAKEFFNDFQIESGLVLMEQDGKIKLYKKTAKLMAQIKKQRLQKREEKKAKKANAVEKMFQSVTAMFWKQDSKKTSKTIDFDGKIYRKYWEVTVAVDAVQVAKYKLNEFLISGLLYEANSAQYNRIMNVISPALGAKEFQTLYINQKQYPDLIQITNISEVQKKKPAGNYSFLDDEVADTVSQQKIANEYIQYKSLDECIKTNFEVKENSCLPVAWMTKFADRIVQLQKDKRYTDFDNTPDYIWKVCYPEKPVPKELKMAVKDFIPVCDKFKHRMTVRNLENEVIFEYCPKSLNKNLATNFDILVHNSHAYLLTDKLQCLYHETEKNQQVSCSTKYSIHDKVERDAFLNNFNELLAFLESFDYAKRKKETASDRIPCSYAIYNDDMKNLLFKLKNNYKYEPRITMDVGQIRTLSLFLNGVRFVLVIPTYHDEDTFVEFSGATEFSQYEERDFEIYSYLVNKKFKSTYNPDFYKTFTSISRSALVGCFNEPNPTEKFFSLDRNKSYPSNLLQVEFFPVYSSQDVFVRYEYGSEIRDWSWYILELKDAANSLDLIYFDQKVIKVCGFTLKQIMELSKVQFTIKYVAHPSNLYKNEIRSKYEALLNSDLPANLKKYIMNKNIGCLGKKFNKKSKTLIFDKVEEAQVFHETPVQVSCGSQSVWVVRQALAEAELTEGFLPIHDLIYDIQRLEMWKLAKQHEKYGVLAIKTDALFIKKCPDFVNPPSMDVNFFGSCKIEEPKLVPQKMIAFCSETDFVRPKPFRRFLDLQLENEANYKSAEYVQEFREIADSLSEPIFVEGATAGTGKSTLIKKYMNKETALIVTPDNKLSIANKKEGWQSVTLYKLLGWVYTESDVKAKTPYSIQNIKVIFFDEMFKYTTSCWSAISAFMKKHPEIKYFGAGDTNQLPCIEELNNVADVRAYMDTICRRIFPRRVVLSIPKRFKEKQVDTILSFKEELFNENNSPMEVVKKYFKPSKDFSNSFCIAYRNEVCDKFNKEIHMSKLHKKGGVVYNDIYYNAGQKLVCRKRFETKSGSIHVNNEYQISAIESNKVQIYEALEGVTHQIDLDKLKFFSLPYVATGHQCQGLTITERVVVFDWDFYHVSREWLYVAFTRSHDMGNCFYYAGEQKVATSPQNYSNRIASYKEQDKKAGRTFQEFEFIDTKWIHQNLKYGSLCKHCGTQIDDCWSVNRLNNTIAHVKSNCYICCINCNKSLK